MNNIANVCGLISNDIDNFCRSGCSGERRAEDIKEALEDNFPDVKYTEFFGRTGTCIPFLFSLLQDVVSYIMSGTTIKDLKPNEIKVHPLSAAREVMQRLNGFPK